MSARIGFGTTGAPVPLDAGGTAAPGLSGCSANGPSPVAGIPVLRVIEALSGLACVEGAGSASSGPAGAGDPTGSEPLPDAAGVPKVDAGDEAASASGDEVRRPLSASASGEEVRGPLSASASPARSPSVTGAGGATGAGEGGRVEESADTSVDVATPATMSSSKPEDPPRPSPGSVSASASTAAERVSPPLPLRAGGGTAGASAASISPRTVAKLALSSAERAPALASLAGAMGPMAGPAGTAAGREGDMRCRRFWLGAWRLLRRNIPQSLRKGWARG